jgi:uncharacterized peroxidase-related enzyme
MPFFKSLSPEAGVGELWAINPAIRKPMNDLGRAIMREDSPLSPALREGVAAFVSAINKCDYCFKGHIEVAAALGADRAAIIAAAQDVDASPLPEKYKPLFRYLRKLTLAPAAMSQADADAVFAAGWSERALHDAILVCCRFNFMNRLSLGHGLDPEGVAPETRAKNMSYAKPAP